ncbi:hypothetical protein AVEN_199554-1 [Araneus ventricosus]|uniref:Uncharacterized protein n=1 Tax=Araneus ventricosus TaxID=182803 RepID=A0A4Y2WHE7_ARAVE|nr:hypothetical protein AVEN_199554-1 [Araneus ventricosus]
MTRTTPELAPPLQTPTPRQQEDVWPLRMVQRAAGPIHGGSSVESGFEPGALRPQGRDLATRPPRPPHDHRKTKLRYSVRRAGTSGLRLRIAGIVTPGLSVMRRVNFENELRKIWWWLVAALKLVCSAAQLGIHRISGSGRFGSLDFFFFSIDRNDSKEEIRLLKDRMIVEIFLKKITFRANDLHYFTFKIYNRFLHMWATSRSRIPVDGAAIARDVRVSSCREQSREDDAVRTTLVLFLKTKTRDETSRRFERRYTMLLSAILII